MAESGGSDTESSATETTAEARTPADGRRLDRLAVAGTLLVLAGLALKMWALRSAYFIEDDLVFFGRAYASELTWDYLLDLHKGHLMPGAMLLVYLHTTFTPYSWGAVSGVMLLLQGAAALTLLRFLWELFGRRWAILVPLTVYVFAPLTLPVLTWWSAALNALPFQLAIVASFLFTVRHVRTGERRYLWYTVGAVLFGMAFSVKAMLLPVFLFVFVLAFLTPGRLFTTPITAVDRHPRLWGGLGALTVGYLILYLTRQSQAGDDGAGVPDPEVSLSMARSMLGETFPIGAVGGPWLWGPITPAGGLVAASTVAAVAAWVVLLLLVGITLWFRPRAWRAWVLLAGYLVAVDLIPTLIARGRYVELVGYDPRYVADAAVIFAVCLALAMLPTVEERERGAGYRRQPPNRRGLVAVLGAAVTAYALAAGYAALTYTDTLSGDRVRWYFDTVGAAEIPEGAAVYPYPVPEHVVLPWNGDDRLSSFVLPPLLGEDGPAVAAPQASARPMQFNEGGYLVDAQPGSATEVVGSPEDEECLPLEEGVFRWDVLAGGGEAFALGIAYESADAQPLTVGVGPEAIETALPPAPDGGVWYVPAAGSGDHITLHTSPDVCVGLLSYGALEPAVQGDPWAESEDDEAADDEEDDSTDDSADADGSEEDDEEESGSD